MKLKYLIYEKSIEKIKYNIGFGPQELIIFLQIISFKIEEDKPPIKIMINEIEFEIKSIFKNFLFLKTIYTN